MWLATLEPPLQKCSQLLGAVYGNQEAMGGFAGVAASTDHHWSTRRQLETAIFDFIEAFYNPSRRHSSLGYLSPTNHEKMNSAAPAA